MGVNVSIKPSRYANDIDDVVTQIIQRYSKKYDNEGDVLWQAMETVRHIAFGDSGLASEYLKRFLAGTGEEKRFQLDQLFQDDADVKNSVEHDIWDRVKKGGNPAISCMKPITIIQQNYSNDDWWGALGTFFIYLGGPFQNYDGTISMTLRGRDRYRWYADEERQDQIIHRLGQRLVDIRRAAEFEMTTPDYTLLLDRNRIEQIKRLKPKEYNPRHGFRFGTAALFRWRMWKASE